MSSNNANYLKAIEKSEIVWSPAVGLVESATNFSTIAKQNNTIIELLVQISNKLDNISSSSQNNPQLAEITAQLANLKLGEQKGTESGTLVRKEPNTIAVWKDPKILIEEFKAKNKK